MLVWIFLTLLLTSSMQARRARTYRAGDIIYLESASGRDTIRIGIHSNWGASIVELSFRGRNFVNHFDHGREVQLSLYGGDQRYDACAGCSGSFGWNPVQAGDRHGQDSPVVAESIGPDFIHTKTVPIEWFPDNKGGGALRSVPTSVTMEQWVTVAPGIWNAIHVRYRIAYSGPDRHSNAEQELPAVYANEHYRRFIYYDGDEPWTSGPVTDTVFTVPFPARILRTTETWACLGDSLGFGMTVFVPEQYPYSAGSSLPGDRYVGPSVYYRPLVTYTWLPGAVLDGDYYLIPGDCRQARRLVYELHAKVRRRDVLTPFGFLDAPKKGAVLSGNVVVSGWAIDESGVSRVDISLDDHVIGAADYGLLRPDLANAAYKSLPRTSGYQYLLNTHGLLNGEHVLEVLITDRAGNRAVFGPIPITIRNQK